MDGDNNVYQELYELLDPAFVKEAGAPQVYFLGSHINSSS